MRHPQVVRVRASLHGCMLQLSDGDAVEVDVSASALERYLTELGYPPLATLCWQRLAEVIYRPIRMREAEWIAIRDVLQSSPTAAAAFEAHPNLNALPTRAYDEVRRTPQRLYNEAVPAAWRAKALLFLSPAVDFRRERRGSGQWYFYLLHAPGGWLLWTYADLASKSVEVTAEHRPDHFVE